MDNTSIPERIHLIASNKLNYWPEKRSSYFILEADESLFSKLFLAFFSLAPRLWCRFFLTLKLFVFFLVLFHSLPSSLFFFILLGFEPHAHTINIFSWLVWLGLADIVHFTSHRMDRTANDTCAPSSSSPLLSTIFSIVYCMFVYLERTMCVQYTYCSGRNITTVSSSITSFQSIFRSISCSSWCDCWHFLRFRDSCHSSQLQHF